MNDNNIESKITDIAPNITLEEKFENVQLELTQNKRLLNLFPSVIYTTSLVDQTSCEFVSDNILDVMGYESQEMINDADFWFNHLHPDDRKQVLEKIFKGIRNGGTMLTYRFQHANGDYRYIEDRFRSIFDTNGKPVEVVGAWTDISERTQIEQKLLESHQTLQERNREIQLLSELNDHLHVCQSYADMQKVLSHFMKKLFPADSGAIFVFNESRSMLELVTQWGDDKTMPGAFHQDDCWGLRKGKLYEITKDSLELVCPHVENISSDGFLCVPLIAQANVMGLLHICVNRQNDNMQQDRNQGIERRHFLALNTSKQLALSMMNLRLRESLKTQAIKDPLTQLYNRRFMLEYMDKELIKANRRNANVGVLMIDVDHFKQYNDVYGHEAGDAVLRELSVFMREKTRDSDVACRYGGEEFTIILPEMPPEKIKQRAQEVCSGVKSIRVTHKKNPLDTISISIGLAIYPEHGETVADLLEEADKALYKAKKLGRDQVVIAEKKPVNNVE